MADENKKVDSNKEIKNEKFKFLGKEFSISELRQLGIDDNAAKELRATILKKNAEAMKQAAIKMPMVLVPHHQVRFWRTDRIREVQDGDLLEPEVFAVTPNNGSRDILGIKFNYDFERGSTDFTITFNNARGKNKNRFSSGDLVEFYFRLLNEDELRGMESSGSLYRKNKEKIVGMPLCFTGALTKYTSKQTPDGLVLEWSGKSGGYICNDRNVSRNFPIDNKKGSAGGAIMSYEEVLWEIISSRTGLVMGEIDLGITEGLTIEGKKARIKGPLDLMVADVESSDTKPFKEDFLAEVEKILLAYPYCRFEEGSGDGTTEDKDEKGDAKRYPRWSVLLEYDLLTPAFFSAADVKARTEARHTGADDNPYGDYIYALDGTATVETNEQEAKEGTVNERIRFKTEWAMKLYAFQMNRVAKNKGMIERSNPIRTQYKLDKDAFMLVRIRREWVSGKTTQDGIFEKLYYEVYGKIARSPEALKEFKKELRRINKMGEGDMFNNSVKNDDDNDEEKAVSHLAANKIPYNRKWKPGMPFTVGDFVAVPIPLAGAKGSPTKMQLEAPVPGLEDKDKGLLMVSTVYAYSASSRNNIDPQFSFRLEQMVGATTDERVTVVLKRENYPSQEITIYDVPNRIDAIAQVLENEMPLETLVTEDGQKDLGQPLKADGTEYKLNKKAVESDWLKASLTAATYEANGSVMDEINKILKKFFSCVFFVDEYGIGHIRPRYKNVQKKEDISAGAPPVWGLYAGQPIYPRLLETEMSDNLKSCPSSIVVHGQVAEGGSVFSKVDHSLLMSMFGENQRCESTTEPINSRLEAKVIAKNILLNHARNALTFACQCDLIPDLRPGHRMDVVDLAIGVVGNFLAESIQWEYSKDTGTKMSVGLTFAELASDDAFTSAAITTAKKDDKGGYNKRLQESINDRTSMLGFSLLRSSQLETGKDKESLKKINPEFADKVLPVFNLGKDGGVIRFIPREGFETFGDDAVPGGEDGGDGET